MPFVLLCLLPACVAAQPSERSGVYLGNEADSLSVVVSLCQTSGGSSENRRRAPAGLLIDLLDGDGNTIEQNRTNEHGEVLFQRLSRHRPAAVSVAVNKDEPIYGRARFEWRAIISEGELLVYQRTPDTDATRGIGSQLPQPITCPPCDPPPCDPPLCCPAPCCFETCCFEPCGEAFQSCIVQPRYSDNRSPRDIGDAKLTVSVPSDAQVFINGTRTSSTGDRRQYVSTGLVPGNRYGYVVRVQAVRNGQTLEATREVALAAGEQRQLSFHLRDEGVSNAQKTDKSPEAAASQQTALSRSP
jgi:uncharacterized protein (TIGR03000 family)